jgi:hypothetical protein
MAEEEKQKNLNLELPFQNGSIFRQQRPMDN